MSVAFGMVARPASGWREQEEELHKGKLETGPHFLWWLTASQAGLGGEHKPLAPGTLRTFPSASFLHRKFQVPATGLSVASCHFPSHSLCLAAQPIRKASSNNPHVSARDKHSGLPFRPQAPPPVCLGAFVWATQPAPPAPPCRKFPQIARTCPLSRRALKSSTQDDRGRFVLFTALSPLAHSRWAGNSC